ncbi:MAG: ASCH domain-containing protein [candidate division Zixibacteria bacterium]|nr:ASCH domain-containing protein [candidate division Zixibacteria bacterium]
MTPDQFWHDYLATLPADHPAHTLPVPEASGFGDSPGLADELGELIHLGTKTATCASLWEHEHDGSALPTVGLYEIVLDGRDQPLAITVLTEVTIRPYDEVDAAFAYDEGEGDRSLENWREGHWRFFSRIHAAIGLEVSRTMPLVCQRFKVVYRR